MVSAIQDFIAGALVTTLLQECHEVIDRGSAKGGGVTSKAKLRAGFPQDTLGELSDRHSARDRVRIHDDIGAYPRLGVGHVFLVVDHPDRSLLPVSRRELVADLGFLGIPDPHLGGQMTLAIHREVCLVHVALLVALDAGAPVPCSDTRWKPLMGVTFPMMIDLESTLVLRGGTPLLSKSV